MIELPKKICKICNELKEEFLFVKSISKSGGFTNRCLQCRKKYAKPKELDILRKNVPEQSWNNRKKNYRNYKSSR